MDLHIRNALIGAAVFGLMFGVPALAQPSAPSKPTASGDGSPAADAETRARVVVERARQALEKSTSYQCTIEMQYVLKAKTSKDEDASQDTKMAYNVLSKRPDRMLMNDETGMMIFAVDGQVARTLMPMYKQYTETKLDATNTLDKVLKDNMVAQSVPFEFVMTSGPGKWLGKIETVREGEFESRAGTWVVGVMGEQSASMPGAEKAKVELFYPRESGLLEAIRVDFTESMREMYGQMGGQGGEGEDEGPAIPSKVEKAEMVYRARDIKLDVPVEDSKFVPDTKGLKKVDAFEFREPGGDPQAELLHKPAPLFKGKGPDGVERELEKLRGSVVVLDFWATWCGPCVQALPHMQSLHEKFKERGVVFLGINSDQSGSGERVAKFLAKKGVTIAQVLDEKGAIGNSYHVRGIPCLVLIGKGGEVEQVHVGFDPSHKESIAQEIETLLKGERVLSAAQVAEKLKATAETAEPAPPEGGAAEVQPLIGEIGAERFALQRVHNQPAWGYAGKAVTLDATVGEVYVFPDINPPGLVVCGPGGSIERIKLGDLTRLSQVTGFGVMGRGAEARWLVSSMVYSPSGSSATRVSCYPRAGGDAIWTYKPEAPKGYTAGSIIESGDVPGDGTTLVVLGTTYIKYNRGSAGSMTLADQMSFVEVLDAKGTLVARKRLAGTISMLRVAPGEKGQPATVLVGTDRSIEKVTFK